MSADASCFDGIVPHVVPYHHATREWSIDILFNCWHMLLSTNAAHVPEEPSPLKFPRQVSSMRHICSSCVHHGMFCVPRARASRRPGRDSDGRRPSNARERPSDPTYQEAGRPGRQRCSGPQCVKMYANLNREEPGEEVSSSMTDPAICTRA